MAKDLRPEPVAFPLPLAGLSTVTPRVSQPQRASVDLRNVRMFGAKDRFSVSPRPGTLPLFGQTNTLGTGLNSNSVANTKEVFQLHQARFDDTYVVAVVDGSIYRNTVGFGTTVGTVALATNGQAAMLAGRYVQCATRGQYTYMIDGVRARKLQLSTNVVSTWTASTGTVPTDYRLMVAARGRIWMAQSDTQGGYVWTCSRQDDPDDWNTAAEDVGASVVSNSGFRGGQVGQTINALIAGKDDTIIFGCRNAIYELVGEPTLGSLLVRSTGVGVLTAGSWCMGPQGEVYFVAPGGFYRLPVAGPPQALNTDKHQSYFDALPDTGYYITCVWDPNRFGVHIWVTPAATGAANHLFYNTRTDGFEPIDLPDDHGPLSAILYDGGRGDRKICLGGRKGIVTYLSDTTASDCNSSGTATANTAITSYAEFGPLRPAGVDNRAKMIGLRVNFGEPPTGFSSSDFHCDVIVKTGPGPYEALNAPSGSNVTVFDGLSGRQPEVHKRLVGEWYYARFGNTNAGKLWVVDDVYGRFLPAGRSS
jgi:hypothetical protein